jgi:acyl-CoA synthetase (AMP-forming)/AMP-acid ligase II
MSAAVPSTVRALIDGRAEVRGNGVCLIDPEQGVSLSFSQVRERVRAIAAGIEVLGIAAGESVAWAMGNSIESVLAVLGIQYSGRRAVAINLVAGRDIIAYALAHSQSRLVLTHAPARSLVEEALAAPTFAKTRAEFPDSSDPDDPPSVLDVAALPTADLVGLGPASGDDALMMYTSGTTGRPKGVCLTHANLLAGGSNTRAGHELTEADRGLCVLPLYHINGLCVTLYGSLCAGASLVIPERFSTSRFWGLVEAHRCTWFSVVPTQVSYLLHAVEPVKVPSLVRFGRSASAPLSPDVLEGFEQRFGLPLIETMGLTETAAQITSNPMPPQPHRTGSPGRAVGCELRIALADGQRAAPDVEGEILVRGDNVMRGYYRNTEATDAAFTPEGWLRTGDLGRLDADGFLYVTGRLKELIIKGGENIAPREVDEALHAHPDVLEAAAFGVACERYGEEVLAAVVKVPGSTIDESTLLDLCEARLGKFKRPRELFFLDELPKGPSGKIQRRHCAALCEIKR